MEFWKDYNKDESMALLQEARARSNKGLCGLCGEAKTVEPLPGIPDVLRCVAIGSCKWPSEKVISYWVPKSHD